MPLDTDLTEFSTASPVLTSFDFTDIADGTGVISFFLAEAEDTGGVETFLTANEAITSRRVAEINSTGQDNDYDITFNTPKDITGTAIVNISVGAHPTSVARTMTVIVTLKHWDGTTETDMGTSTSASFTTAATNAIDSRRQCLLIPITTLQHFAAGDALRVNVVTTTTTGNGPFGYGIDPAGRADTIQTIPNQIIKARDSTKAEVLIPFRLNI